MQQQGSISMGFFALLPGDCCETLFTDIKTKLQDLNDVSRDNYENSITSWSHSTDHIHKPLIFTTVSSMSISAEPESPEIIPNGMVCLQTSNLPDNVVSESCQSLKD